MLGKKRNVEPEAGARRPISLQPGVIMTKDRIFESAVIAVGVVSSALAVWVIFSV